MRRSFQTALGRRHCLICDLDRRRLAVTVLFVAVAVLYLTVTVSDVPWTAGVARGRGRSVSKQMTPPEQHKAPQLPDSVGQTPIMHAAKAGCFEPIKALLAAGGDLYHKDKNHKMALNMVSLKSQTPNPKP